MAANEKFDSEDLTAQVLHDMLQENTGVHMLDSGMSCGRHWQQNQGRDFENEIESRIEADRFCFLVSHNVYHWLKSRLTFNPELDQDFQDFATTSELEREPWPYCVEKYMEKLKDADEDVGGLYGEGDPMMINTYNGEQCLSQILQFAYWEDKDGAHVLLQIHGGADVRGGYSQPRAFDVTGYSELAMFDFDRAVVSCTDAKPLHDPKQTHFPSQGPEDCGLTWDLHGSNCEYVSLAGGEEMRKYDLDKIQIVDFDADPEDTPDGEEPAPGKGYIFVDEDKTPHCPRCGSPLKSYFM